jgi:hypothetical protein
MNRTAFLTQTLLAVLVALLAGCTAADESSIAGDVSGQATPVAIAVPAAMATTEPGATTDPDAVRPSPEVTAPPPGDCRSYTTFRDGAPPTVEILTRVASSAFVGTITEVGPARWNTVDGEAPSRDAIEGDSVVRLAKVQVTEPISGAAGADGAVTVALPGGQMGCDVFEDADIPLEVEPGDTYVFFVGSPGRLHVGEGDLATAMWPVSPTGAVATPTEGTMSVEELVRLAAD